MNFKDLLKVLGQLSSAVTEDTFFEGSFGMECSGTVVAVGEKVEHLKVGDEVLGSTRGCFASYGLGLQIAQWLSTKGIHQLVLLSRCC